MNQSEQLTARDVSPSLFVDRDMLLQSLRTRLLTENIVLLTGASGSGKTALAREYARRFAHEYTGVLWLDMTTPESFMADVLAQGPRFLLSTEVVQKGFAGLSEMIEEWASKHHILFVLDNVLFPADTPQRQERHPIAGHVLLIGRGGESQLTVTCLTTKPLDIHEGALLVLRQARLLAPDAPLELASDEQGHQALELASELSGSPLALTLASGYLNATNCDLQDYLLASRDCPERPDNAPDAEMQILEITCNLTLACLARSQAAALRVLQACSLLSPCAIPQALFQQESLQQVLFPEESEQRAGQLGQAIQTLLTYRVLDVQEEMNTCSIHALLRTTIRQTLPEKQQQDLREKLLVACLQLALASESTSTGELPASGFSLAGHIRCLATESEERAFSLKEAADAHAWAALLLGRHGVICEAEALLCKALRIWERTASCTNPSIASASFYLAIFNAQLRQYSAAEMYAQLALTNTAQILGVSHFRVLACLNILADIYQQQGKLKNASLCYQQAISIGDRTGLHHHPLYFAARQELLKLGSH